MRKAFATIVAGQIWHIFDARTSSTIFRKSPFGNSHLLLAVGASIALTLIAIYSGLGNLVLGTTPVSAHHLLGVAAVAALPTLALSAVKELFNLKVL